jgi:hypothetical protein
MKGHILYHYTYVKYPDYANSYRQNGDKKLERAGGRKNGELLLYSFHLQMDASDGCTI